MKWIHTHRYPLFFLFVMVLLTSGAFALVFHYNPEKALLGKWKETGWSYENVDEHNFLYHDVKLKRKHESESWRFSDEHRLFFYNTGEIMATATWKIKGRGHVLELTYEDGEKELYDIKELNDHELVLNFDIGMETRGIARLVFTKTANQ